MRCVLPEELKDLLARGTNYVVDLVDLVEFIVTRKQRAQGQDLIHDTANSPNIHFITVIAVGEEALRCTVPTSRYVLGERLVLVQSSAAA